LPTATAFVQSSVISAVGIGAPGSKADRVTFRDHSGG